MKNPLMIVLVAIVLVLLGCFLWSIDLVFLGWIT